MDNENIIEYLFAHIKILVACVGNWFRELDTLQRKF
jgi:hypothetical protein